MTDIIRQLEAEQAAKIEEKRKLPEFQPGDTVRVSVRVTDFVEAAYGSGGTFFGVLWRHILPNSLTPVIALAALQFGSAILQISTLGFLGYGAPPPTPEWGLLIAEGRNYVVTAWWLTVLPGLIVVFVVLATNRLSQALRGGDAA